jgi:hypothetical protein
MFHYLLKIPDALTTTDTGSFVCKVCKQKTSYHFKERVERRLLMFMVPIQGDTIETFVECQTCMNRFPPDCLRGSPPDDLKVIAAIKERLLAGQSAQKVEEDLAKTGAAEPLVKKYVRVAIGISKKNCPQCDSTYHSSARKCTKCGVLLPA